MHRALAAWLTEYPWRPIVASALCGALAQLMLPLALLACAIPVLTVLRFDARLGLAAAEAGAHLVVAGHQPVGVGHEDAPPPRWGPELSPGSSTRWRRR